MSEKSRGNMSHFITTPAGNYIVNPGIQDAYYKSLEQKNRSTAVLGNSAVLNYMSGNAGSPGNPSKTANKAPSKSGLIQVCAVFSVIASLLANRVLRNPEPKKAYGDPIVVTTQNANSWTGIVNSIYGSSATFYVETGCGQAWAGSGVVISSDGYILTNDHVAGDSDISLLEVTINDDNHSVYRGELIATDADSDVAIVKITPENELTFARIGNSDPLQVGDDVIAIGNPLGMNPDTVSEGIVSYLYRRVDISGRATQHLIQITAPISSGNSGGGLFNSRGELVGLVNAGAVSYWQPDGSIVTAQDIGYAVPINRALELIAYRAPQLQISQAATLGWTLCDVLDKDLVKELGYDEQGVYIAEVPDHSAAWFAGLQSGDRIASIEDVPVSSASDLLPILSSFSVGDPIRVEIERDDHLYVYSIVLMRDYI